MALKLMTAAVGVRLWKDAQPPYRRPQEKMMKWPEIVGVVMLFGVALTAGGVQTACAATSTTLDILPNDIAGPPERMEVGNLKPLAVQKRDTGKVFPSGNPLWSVPLSVLTATQERPVFSASRRPPPRAVVGPLVEPVAAPVVQKLAEPEHPPLVLIGAVVGESDAIAVFLDRTSQGVVRLRTGETHLGWELGSVLPREVTLRKADQVEVLALQRPADSPAAAGSPVLPIQPAQVVQPANGGYVPFIPRSTPKNGESDGL
jgi:general secretion pathway protein N